MALDGMPCLSLREGGGRELVECEAQQRIAARVTRPSPVRTGEAEESVGSHRSGGRGGGADVFGAAKVSIVVKGKGVALRGCAAPGTVASCSSGADGNQGRILPPKRRIFGGRMLDRRHAWCCWLVCTVEQLLAAHLEIFGGQ